MRNLLCSLLLLLAAKMALADQSVCFCHWLSCHWILWSSFSLKSPSFLQIYSVKTVAEFSWTTDDDGSRLSTSQIYQLENAAATYFGELLNDWLEQDETVDPLTTRVAITDQNVGLTETGEMLRFEVPSIVEFQYIGEKEIPSITATLQNLTANSLDEPAYANMQILAGARPASSFTISFSNTTMNASTLLYTVVEPVPSESNTDGQTGLIIACTLATISLIMASLILMWAVGVFDGVNVCKNLRSRFYLPPIMSHEDQLPYGMNTKSTAEETNVDEHIGAVPMHDDEECALQDQGIEMTPSRGIFREEDEDMLSPVDSEFSTGEETDISHVSSVAPLGIASMRKEKRHAAAARKSSIPQESATLSPESILADIQSFHMDID